MKKKNYTTPNTQKDYLLSFETKEEEKPVFTTIIDEPEPEPIEEPKPVKELEPIEEPQPVKELEPYRAKVKISFVKYLNIRTQPNLNCDVARTAQNNDILTIVKEENGWGQLEDNNWVNLQYVEKI